MDRRESQILICLDLLGWELGLVKVSLTLSDILGLEDQGFVYFLFFDGEGWYGLKWLWWTTPHWPLCRQNFDGGQVCSQVPCTTGTYSALWQRSLIWL